jgi:transposase
MSEKPNSVIAVIGIDIGKNSFHVVGLDERGAIVLRQKWSRGQVETRLPDQLDLQALHRVRERLVGQRTGIINQIRAFLLERGDAGQRSRICGSARRAASTTHNQTK